MNVAIFAFGDSITYGRSDLDSGGWVNRVWRHLHSDAAKHPDWRVHVYNLGIRGDTSRGVAARLRREAEPRQPGDVENIFILACGTNDAAFVPATNTHVVPLDEFADNLESAIRHAMALPRAHILLFTIAPVVDDGASRSNRHVERYNEKIAELAAKHRARLVDVYTDFTSGDPRALISDDGLHPNADGHARIATLVLAAIYQEVGAG